MIGRTDKESFVERLRMAIEFASDRPPMSQGDELRRWMVDRLALLGLTVTPDQLADWLAGETKPDERAIISFAQILEVDALWLLGSN